MSVSFSKVAKKIGGGIKSAVTTPLPQSITWIYSLGFKIGLFLILKVFLLLRYQYFNLSKQGIWMLIGQGILGIILISAGAILQDQKFYDDPVKLKNVSRLYLLGSIIPLITTILSYTDNWKYFLAPINSNIFNNILANIKEFLLAIAFIDKDVMIFIAILLYIISSFYLVSSFGIGSLFGTYKVIDESGIEVTKTNNGQKVASIITIIMFFGSILLVPSIVHMNKVRLPYSSSEIVKITYPELKDTLDSLGLKDNVSIIAENKTLLDKEDSVKSFIINGAEEFPKNTWVSIKEPIELHIVRKYNKFPTEDLLIINQEKTYTLPIEGDDVSWHIEDETIASVDNGKVKGLSEGQTNVTVTIDGITYKLELSVVEKTTLEKISEVFKKGTNDISDTFKDGYEKVEEATKEFGESVSASTSDVIEEIKNLAEKTGSTISSFFKDIGK